MGGKRHGIININAVIIKFHNKSWQPLAAKWPLGGPHMSLTSLVHGMPNSIPATLKSPGIKKWPSAKLSRMQPKCPDDLWRPLANLGDRLRPWRPSTTEKSMTLKVHGDRWRPLTPRWRPLTPRWRPLANFGVPWRLEAIHYGSHPWRPKSLHLGLKMTTNIHLVTLCNIKGFIMLCPDPTCNYMWMQISTFLEDLVQQHSKGKTTSNSNHME